MKKSLITLLLLIPFLAFSQNEPKIPKKANVIFVLKKDLAVNVLTDYAKKLQDHNFSIDRLDEKLLSLRTEPKTYKFSGVATLKIYASTRQHGDTTVLKITGNIEVTNPMAGSPVIFESCYCGMKGNAQINSFIEMISTIEGYNQDRIVYMKTDN